MKKLIIICLLALTYNITYSQYDETYSNDWGAWENCSDFKDIKFRIKGNYVKGQKFRSVDIQFKNDYETGVYFYFFVKDLSGNENTITNQGHWKIFRLNKGESKEANRVKMNNDEESLDIYIGGVYFSGTNKSEPPKLNSKLSYTYPDIINNSEQKDLCLYCTLFKNNKIFCPEGRASDMSNPWSAYDSAFLGPKISIEQSNAKKAELEKFANSTAGQVTIAAGSAVVLTKGISDVIKLHKEFKQQDENEIWENIENYKKDKNESDISAFNREKKRLKKQKAGNTLLTVLGGAVGAGLGILIMSAK